MGSANRDFFTFHLVSAPYEYICYFVVRHIHTHTDIYPDREWHIAVIVHYVIAHILIPIIHMYICMYKKNFLSVAVRQRLQLKKLQVWTRLVPWTLTMPQNPTESVKSMSYTTECIALNQSVTADA